MKKIKILDYSFVIELSFALPNFSYLLHFPSFFLLSTRSHKFLLKYSRSWNVFHSASSDLKLIFYFNIFWCCIYSLSKIIRNWMCLPCFALLLVFESSFFLCFVFSHWLNKIFEKWYIYIDTLKNTVKLLWGNTNLLRMEITVHFCKASGGFPN